MAVSFTAEVEKQLLTLEKRYPQLTLFIREVLAQDPRPAYRKGEETGKTYAVWLHDLTFAGASPTQVLKSLRWNRVKFTPFSFDISFALVN
ncbi:methyltransferase [Escherichia coli]|uniref:Methyltransferase n=1 Tax=Escherichia coli TaxID=562 RepID=A0A376RNL2_ECOLX|nr:methyltransferase [Escherichia coli]